MVFPTILTVHTNTFQGQGDDSKLPKIPKGLSAKQNAINTIYNLTGMEPNQVLERGFQPFENVPYPGTYKPRKVLDWGREFLEMLAKICSLASLQDINENLRVRVDDRIQDHVDVSRKEVPKEKTVATLKDLQALLS